MDQKQYNKYKQIATKITKHSELSEDLLHDVLLQLDNNEKFNTLSDKDKVFFFIRTLTNQYYSSNSKFQRTYRLKYEEFNNNVEVEDKPYHESPTIDWVNETLDKELKNNKEFWYNHGLFKMYLEHKKIKLIHDRTRIPIYSIRATIKEMRLWLRNKWEEYGKD
jgi:hypothetical protein